MLSIEQIRSRAREAAQIEREVRARGSHTDHLNHELKDLFHSAGGNTHHSWQQLPTGEKINGWAKLFEFLADFRSAARILARMSYRTAGAVDVWDEAIIEDSERAIQRIHDDSDYWGRIQP